MVMSKEEEYSKSKDKKMVDDAVKKFLKRGGKIEKLRSGMSADEYHQREPGSIKVKRFGR
mgnify:CR=1 FL=1|tara:strand:- start:1118 stop:1297 length:180 start_codon:yes stop_codon:yes gene_type:complete